MSRRRVAGVVVLALGGLAGLAGGVVPAAAHEGNIGLSEIVVDEKTIDYTLWLDVSFLADELPMPAVEAGTDLQVSRADAESMVERGVRVSASGVPLVAELVELRSANSQDLTQLGGVAMMDPTPLLELRLRYAAPEPVTDFAIEYDLFLPDEGREPHSNVAWVEVDDVRGYYMFAPGGSPLTPDRVEPLEEVSDGDGGGTAALVVGVVAVGAAGVLVVLVVRSRRRALKAGRGRVPVGRR